MKKELKSPEHIPLDITLINPKRGSKHRAPCMLPMHAMSMTREQIKEAYSDHMVDALFELLSHKSFRQGIEPRKLIIVGDEAEA